MNKMNQIYLKYQAKEKKINIFGENFVKNNKKNCKFIFNKKEYEIMHYFEIPNWKNNIIIEIILILVSNNIDISYMFSGCTSLLFISENLSNLDISNSKNMNSFSCLHCWKKFKTTRIFYET